LTTAGAEASTSSEISVGNAAFAKAVNPITNKRVILFLKRFILFPLIN
jgi:hypothetical protein